MFYRCQRVVRPQRGASLRLESHPAARFISLPATKFREERSIETTIKNLLGRFMLTLSLLERLAEKSTSKFRRIFIPPFHTVKPVDGQTAPPRHKKSRRLKLELLIIIPAESAFPFPVFLKCFISSPV
jgi:hypothetical protein